MTGLYIMCAAILIYFGMWVSTKQLCEAIRDAADGGVK